MKTNIIHSTAVFLAALALSLAASCSGQEELQSKTAEAALYLNVATIDQTRSNLNDLPANEKMGSLRVILLHSDGTVEHNRFYQLSGALEEKNILLKVKPGEKKKIYIFANEESVASVEGVTGGNRTLTAFFDSFAQDSQGFAGEAESLYFAPDYTDGKAIPMSSVYEIDFPNNGNVERTFYVVRVATKFTVKFENWRDEQVKVNSICFASHSDRNFMMAHVNDSEQNRQLFGDGVTWIEWLKRVSDASSENDDYATTEAAGWLKDYDLPSSADTEKSYSHGAVTIAPSVADADNPGNTTPGSARVSFYLPESKNLKQGAPDGEQEYTMTLDIEGRPQPFVNVLPNLKSLFRNTHVVVNISMYTSEIRFRLTVEPWVPGGRTEIEM